MKQLFSISFLVLLYLIQSTIEAKSSRYKKKPPTKKPSTQRKLPSYVQCYKPIKYHFEITKHDRFYVEGFIDDINDKTFLKFHEENNLIEGVGINFFSNNKEDKVELSYDDKKPTVVNLTKETYDTIENIQSETFLKFTKEKYPIRNVGINFYSNNKEDKVELSYDDKKPTVVNLTKETYGYRHLVGYYLGYALGLIPELARKDRDSDFYPYYENQISKYNDFSFNDYKRLNLLYCKDICKKSKTCGNYGYYGNNCDSCECFYPFHGKDCTLYHERHSECGKDITIKAYSKAKEKKLKNISLGECFYIIKANNPKKKVKLTIKRFKGVPGRYKLEIKYRKDKGAEHLKINGDVTWFKFPPLSSSVIINFVSYSPGNELELKYQEV
uniref:Astacin domain-containing protein n=1 Tax=Strongyloides papillosus TaxID=174720 RepID=A0A0N5BUR6_STREA